jgi:hypothetical protein
MKVSWGRTGRGRAGTAIGGLAIVLTLAACGGSTPTPTPTVAPTAIPTATTVPNPASGDSDGNARRRAC